MPPGIRSPLESRMTREQQKRLNAMCGDLSAQVMWPVRTPTGEWEPTYLHKDDWRHIFAGIQLGERYVANPEDAGKFITLAASSRRLTDEEASILIERLFAFGNSRDVRWSDPEEIAMRAAYEREVA